jgi:transposase InsO family protein
MRENNLLSPHRVVQRQPKKHDGKIITAAPNVMWGTDGTKVFTSEEGWCWLFTAVEHWNAECVGWHVSKNGDRFAALQPVSMAIKARFGSVGSAAARGLVLRMDHGTQYLSEHFQNQIKFWGITPSFAFVAEPQTNGVTERFNRTLKEQVIYGRQYRTIEEVRSAIADFVDRYNQSWLVEKLGFRSPRRAFEEYKLQVAA